MAEAQYNFSVRLVGYDKERRRELQEYILKTLHPKKGIDFFKDLLRATQASEESGEVVYQTNNPNDARRMAFTLYSHGGMAAIDGDLEPEDDGL